MAFSLLPAVDIADGHLSVSGQGTTPANIESSNPLDAALMWQADGAEWIHLVDVDAAFDRGSNAELLTTVIEHLDINVELSGGIRDAASLERALSTGCERVVISASALHDPTWCSAATAEHGDRIALGIDVASTEHRDGTKPYHLTARGRGDNGGDLWETIEMLDLAGCARYVVTDVNKDGMLTGPNLELRISLTEALEAMRRVRSRT